MDDLEARGVMRAVYPHSKHIRDRQLVVTAVDEGYLRLREDTVTGVDIPEKWIEQHAVYSSIDPREADGHHRIKIAVAEHLDESGWDMERIDNPADDPVRPYLYDGFEYDCHFGVADVASPDHGVFAEIGRINPYRILSAFGLQATLIRGVWHDKDTGVRSLYTAPVKWENHNDGSFSVYEFSSGPNLGLGASE